MVYVHGQAVGLPKVAGLGQQAGLREKLGEGDQSHRRKHFSRVAGRAGAFPSRVSRRRRISDESRSSHASQVIQRPDFRHP